MSKVNEIRANSLLGDFGVIYALTGWLYTRSPRSISFSSSQSPTNDILQVKSFPNIMIKVELVEKYKKRYSCEYGWLVETGLVCFGMNFPDLAICGRNSANLNSWLTTLQPQLLRFSHPRVLLRHALCFSLPMAFCELWGAVSRPWRLRNIKCKRSFINLMQTWLSTASFECFFAWLNFHVATSETFEFWIM